MRRFESEGFDFDSTLKYVSNLNISFYGHAKLFNWT